MISAGGDAAMSDECEETAVEKASEHKALRAIGWFSVGMAAASLGIFLGFEIRSRYKFKRRTPYDFYSNVDGQAISEYGVGI
ncbi:MAG TPA: hypothetical protein VG225_17075 [Terracidiphilus sp.]|jgi:hypothetical protein|nr:hypothetical protein [Terracidiphilus sp.]